MQSQHILNALKFLVEELETIRKPPRFLLEEVSELISEFLEEIFAAIQIQEIERKILTTRSIDVFSIQKAIDLIQRYKPEIVKFPSGENQERIIDPNLEIKNLQNALDVIKKNQSRLGQLEVLLRIDLYFDARFDEIMMSLEDKQQAFNDIKELAVTKLSKIKEDEMLLLWARLKNQFNRGENRPKFINYPDIIPPEFWSETSDTSVIRERFSRFIVEYKPLTVKRMLTQGYSHVPWNLPGIARVLGLNGDSESLTNFDLLVVKICSKIIALTEKISFLEGKDIARSLRIDPSSLIFDGEFYQANKKWLDEGTQKPLLESLPKLLFLNCSKLWELVQESNVNPSQVATTLWNFKLGQEVSSAIRKQEIEQIRMGEKNETDLQKELSRFLIERGILSFGRTFGRSEIDLYIKETPGEDFVIEAKIYKESPTETQLRSHITQLLSYMDQIKQPRGVLAIFNCSNCTLIAPKKWLKGQLWILAINLCDAAPSKRKRSIEIRESEDKDELFFCIENGSESAKKQKRSKK